MQDATEEIGGGSVDGGMEVDADGGDGSDNDVVFNLPARRQSLNGTTEELGGGDDTSGNLSDSSVDSNDSEAFPGDDYEGDMLDGQNGLKSMDTPNVNVADIGAGTEPPQRHRSSKVCKCVGGIKPCTYSRRGVVYKQDDVVFASSGSAREPHLIAKIVLVHPKERRGMVKVKLFYRAHQLSPLTVKTTHAQLAAGKLAEQFFHLHVFPGQGTHLVPRASLRGLCSVLQFSQIENPAVVLAEPYIFFTTLDHELDPRHVLTKHIQIGSDAQPVLPALDPPAVRDNNGHHDRRADTLATLVWEPQNPAVSLFDAFLPTARSIGTMLRQAAWPSRSISDAFAGASRDATLQQAHDLYFASAAPSVAPKHRQAILALMLKTPLASDPLEKWSQKDRAAFCEGLAEHGKNFQRMQASHLPSKSVREIVDFYFGWKTTESYIHYRVHHARGAHRKARRSMIEKLTKLLDDPYVSDDSADDKRPLRKKEKQARLLNVEMQLPCSNCHAPWRARWHGSTKDNVPLCRRCRTFRKRYGIDLDVAAHAAVGLDGAQSCSDTDDGGSSKDDNDDMGVDDNGDGNSSVEADVVVVKRGVGRPRGSGKRGRPPKSRFGWTRQALRPPPPPPPPVVSGGTEANDVLFTRPRRGRPPLSRAYVPAGIARGTIGTGRGGASYTLPSVVPGGSYTGSFGRVYAPLEHTACADDTDVPPLAALWTGSGDQRMQPALPVNFGAHGTGLLPRGPAPGFVTLEFPPLVPFLGTLESPLPSRGSSPFVESEPAPKRRKVLYTHVAEETLFEPPKIPVVPWTVDLTDVGETGCAQVLLDRLVVVEQAIRKALPGAPDPEAKDHSLRYQKEMNKFMVDLNEQLTFRGLSIFNRLTKMAHGLEGFPWDAQSSSFYASLTFDQLLQLIVLLEAAYGVRSGRAKRRQKVPEKYTL